MSLSTAKTQLEQNIKYFTVKETTPAQLHLLSTPKLTDFCDDGYSFWINQEKDSTYTITDDGYTFYNLTVNTVNKTKLNIPPYLTHKGTEALELRYIFEKDLTKAFKQYISDLIVINQRAKQYLKNYYNF